MKTENLLLITSDKINDYIAIKTLTGSKPSKQIIKESLAASNNLSVLSNGYMYGSLAIDSKLNIQLISIASLGALRIELKQHFGAVLLLDGLNVHPVKELKSLLAKYPKSFFEGSLSIGVFNTKKNNPAKKMDINNELRRIKLNAAVFDIELLDYRDLSLLIQSMLLTKLHSA